MSPSNQRRRGLSSLRRSRLYPESRRKFRSGNSYLRGLSLRSRFHKHCRFLRRRRIYLPSLRQYRVQSLWIPIWIEIRRVRHLVMSLQCADFSIGASPATSQCLSQKRPERLQTLPCDVRLHEDTRCDNAIAPPSPSSDTNCCSGKLNGTDSVAGAQACVHTVGTHGDFQRRGHHSTWRDYGRQVSAGIGKPDRCFGVDK